jgi:hypothetical protein
MKGIFYIFLFFAICFNSYSQIEYEKGYYIDNNGQKTDGLIKNKEWKNNPDNFKFKVNEDSEASNKTIVTCEEFGVSTIKYKRFIVNIDMSNPKKSSNLSESRNPEFIKDTLYLKVLVEGKASLYYYTDGNIERFL